MGNEKDELSDDEYAALLRDLEGRANSGSATGGGKNKKKSKSAADDDVEDIDAFLKSLESSEEPKSSAKKTATADVDDKLAREFASLEKEGELTAPRKPKKKKEKKKKKEDRGEGTSEELQNDQKTDSSEEGQRNSRGKRFAIIGLKTVAWFLPALTLWWVLGTFLGLWVSAGWLIAVISSMFVFGVPVLLKKVARRGTYRPWLLGASLVLVVALVAPMPNVAGQNMAHYGHWPATAVVEIAGAPADAGFVVSAGSAAGWLGGVISTADDAVAEPRQLGTIFPLGMQWPPPEELIPLLEGDFDASQLDLEGSPPAAPVEE